MTVMTFFFRKMILSKSCKGTESSSFIGFLKKKLFRIKERRRPKSPPPPSYSLSAWYRFKGLLLKQIKTYFFGRWESGAKSTNREQSPQNRNNNVLIGLQLRKLRITVTTTRKC